MTLPRRPKSLLLLLLLGLVGGGGVDGADAFKPITYHHCKAPGASTAIAIMNVTGDLPAKAASTFVVHVSARPVRPLIGGRVSMQISAKGIKIATRHFDICRDIDLACPVPAGEQVVAKFKFPVPFYAITMSADVVITAVSSDGEGLICLEAPGVPVVGWNGAQGEGQKGMDSDSDGVAPSSPSLRRPQMAHIGDVEMIRHVFLAL